MTTVLAHGVFDLLHIGHVRHLWAARGMGDKLIVSITADEFVGKGPGRPVFSADHRSDVLISLKFVDEVVLSEAPNAVKIIERIKPGIFVKGSDYRDSLDPEERAAVERVGGRVEFTDEVTFSSTTLINDHIRERPPFKLDDILLWFDRIKDYRALVIGDLIFDEYQYVVPMGKPPKEHILACRWQSKANFVGGVAAAAHYLRPFVAEARVVTEHSTRKVRFIDPSQMRKLFEVYYIEGEVTDATVTRLENQIADLSPKADIVVVTDFGHGLLTAPSIDLLQRAAPWLAVNCQTNSANLGFNLITKYRRRVDYICLDENEARMAFSDRRAPLAELAWRLNTIAPKVIITCGKDGCVTWERGLAHEVPAVAKSVVDTMGAGDAFFAVTAPLVAAGMPLHQAGFVGNVMAALKVGKVGHHAITKPDLIKAITGLLK
jgi:rfaE bifunctional protein nucleotidyltransferase chain/domain